MQGPALYQISPPFDGSLAIRKTNYLETPDRRFLGISNHRTAPCAARPGLSPRLSAHEPAGVICDIVKTVANPSDRGGVPTMATTRRLAAILAADVAGYSRLMGANEEGTHERLQAHLAELANPKITDHQGRVVKNTGDSGS